MSSNKQDVPHIYVVAFSTQGHVNPLIRLAKFLASKGNLLVTFSASKSVEKKMKEAGASVSGDPTPVGNYGGMIRFEFFNDRCPEDDNEPFDVYFSNVERYAKSEVAKNINRHRQEGRPVSCLINDPYVPWVSDVALEFNIPCALLWVQSCACFSSYYHYHNSLAPFPSEENPNIDVQLPNMPRLKPHELPSFLHPSTPYTFLRKAILNQFKNLSNTFCILMGTFDELEGGLIKYMSQICPIRAVGPLFMHPVNETTLNISGDLIKADDCLAWLNSKETSSVVYISFGSVVNLTPEQLTELAYGLLNSGLSFLWVLREGVTFTGVRTGTLPEGLLEAAGDRGMVVEWSPQARVLTHPAVSCFVTHCGWNSTMEALSSGVPVVAFPQWGDQVIDAKYLVDEWKVGVRLSRGEAEDTLIGREEVEERLREATSGEKATEIKKNALKWKQAAEEAVAEGGTSDVNIHDFIDDIIKNTQVKSG